ncbi:MAG: AAA family ATPase, partial [Phycisphaerae bacterium]
YNVSFADLQGVYRPALRHRVLLNFEAQAEGVESDVILNDALEKTPTAVEAAA